MKRFEIYKANLPYGSTTGNYVIILENEIPDNRSGINWNGMSKNRQFECKYMD